jgi:hypothetical protein
VGRGRSRDSAGGVRPQGLVSSDMGVLEAGGAAWMQECTPGERNAVARYTGDEYKSINADLRDGIDISGDLVIGGIDSALAKAPKHGDLWVRRNGVKEQKSFVDRGFVSTSVQRRLAMPQSGVWIHVPAGRYGGYVASVSAHSNEQEFLLKRGTTFVWKTASDGTRYLEVVGT